MITAGSDSVMNGGGGALWSCYGRQRSSTLLKCTEFRPILRLTRTVRLRSVYEQSLAEFLVHRLCAGLDWITGGPSLCRTGLDHRWSVLYRTELDHRWSVLYGTELDQRWSVLYGTEIDHKWSVLYGLNWMTGGPSWLYRNELDHRRSVLYGLNWITGGPSCTGVGLNWITGGPSCTD